MRSLLFAACWSSINAVLSSIKIQIRIFIARHSVLKPVVDVLQDLEDDKLDSISPGVGKTTLYFLLRGSWVEMMTNL